MSLACPFEPDPDFPGIPAADPSLPDMPWLEADVPPCPAAAPEEPEDCPCIDPLCPADMPPPACAPVPAFPPAPTCAPATPDIPYSKPAIKAVCDICFKLNILCIMPPSSLRLTSIGRKRMICPLFDLFRSISRIAALRQRAFKWERSRAGTRLFRGIVILSLQNLVAAVLRLAERLSIACFGHENLDTRRHRGDTKGSFRNAF